MPGGMDEHAGHEGHAQHAGHEGHAGHAEHAGHHDAAMGTMDMHMMGSFFTSRTTSHFLFEGLSINSSYGIATAMVIICSLAIMNDVIIYITYLHSADMQKINTHQKRFVNNVQRTLQKTFTVILGYIIMLAVMTFNYWILISAVVGSGVGYFVGRPLLSQCLYTPTESEARHEASEELLHDFQNTNDNKPGNKESGDKD